MKNSENKIKKQNDSRVFAYKAISLASLSTLALTLGLNNLKEAKALMGKTGTIRFFGTSNSRVVKPGNMGSTGATGYSVKSAVPGGGTKVTGGAITGGSKGFAKFNLQFGNPYAKPYLDSLRPSGTGSNSSSKTNPTKTPTTNGNNGTSKFPTTGSVSSGSSLSSGLSRNPSTTSSSSNSSSTSSTLSRPSSGSNNASVGVYENPTNGNNNTNGNKKLTPKQKVGLVTVGSLGVLGVLAAVGVGVGAAQNTNNKSDSNGTKGPESVPTPKDPTNSDKVVNSALGNNYTDTKA